jgi:hypothetical protein
VLSTFSPEDKNSSGFRNVAFCPKYQIVGKTQKSANTYSSTILTETGGCEVVGIGVVCWDDVRWWVQGLCAGMIRRADWKMSVIPTRQKILLYLSQEQVINTFMPELNPSAQRCLTRFFTWNLFLEPEFR